MKLQERLSEFWNVTLGPDITDDDKELSVNSPNNIEAELAKSVEEIDKKWSAHFASTNKAKDKYKVDSSKLNKELKADNKKKEAKQIKDKEEEKER